MDEDIMICFLAAGKEIMTFATVVKTDLKHAKQIPL